MADMVQCSFFFNRVPFLKVGEGEPTRNWHRTQTVRDAFEKPEWAVSLICNSCPHQQAQTIKQIWFRVKRRFLWDKCAQIFAWRIRACTAP